MRQQGRLTAWNDDRGFGFITPLGGGPEVFVHVSEFSKSLRRPMALDLVSFGTVRDERGRLRAEGVEFLAPTRASHHYDAGSPTQTSVKIALVASACFFVTLVVLGLFVPTAWTILAVDALMSVITFAAYGDDKRAAQSGRWRTQENALHLMGLVGGWPGALVAQRVYHHKTRKPAFQVVFWLTVIGNGLIVAVLLANATLMAAPG